MTKKNPGRRPGLVSRFALARVLHVSLTSVDRLIAAGLKPAAHRGRAKLYSLVDARRLAQREKRATESTNLIALADAKARRVRGDLLRLGARYVSPEQIAREWSWLVERVRRATMQMLDSFTTTAPPAEPEPPRDHRFLTPDDLRTLLAADPATHPWPAPATPAITRCAASGVGVELLRRSNGWHELNAEWLIGLRAATPADPITSAIRSAARNVLTALSQMKPPVTGNLARPLPPVKRSRSLRDSRSQLAFFQARLVALRDTIISSAVIRRDDAVSERSTRVIAYRSKLLTLHRIAPRLEEAGVVEGRAILRRHVDEALAELRPRNPSNRGDHASEDRV